MADPSDKSPTGAAESNREKADEQYGRKLRANDEPIQDLEDPRSDRVKGGIPKQPDMGGPR